MLLRICTGFKGVSFRETHLWEQFGRPDKIALITCLKKLNVSGAFLTLRVPWHLLHPHLRQPNFLEGWQRAGAQKGGFENALFNLKSPWKYPDFWSAGFSSIFKAFFMAQLPWKVHEKCLKNALKTLDLKIRVFSGGFQIPPFVPPPFAILGFSFFLKEFLNLPTISCTDHLAPATQSSFGGNPRRAMVWGTQSFLAREELKGTNLMGQTGFCETLRFPAVFCGFLRNSVVSCGFLRNSAVSCGFLRRSAPPKCCVRT